VDYLSRRRKYTLPVEHIHQYDDDDIVKASKISGNDCCIIMLSNIDETGLFRPQNLFSLNIKGKLEKTRYHSTLIPHSDLIQRWI
jgi:hypothetical protein